MRCFPRLPICVVSLIILLSISVWGGVLNEKRVEEIVKEKIGELYGKEIRIVELDPHLREPISYQRIRKVRIKLRRGEPRGYAYIYLRTGRSEKIVTVILRVKWRCELYVLNEDVGRGERIYPWMVVLEETYRDRCPRQYIEDTRQLINYVALKPLSRGEALKKSTLKPEPLVRRGEDVNVIYRSGNLEISFTGEALENGFYGERIRVRSANTGKILRGRVVGEGSVVVE